MPKGNWGHTSIKGHRGGSAKRTGGLREAFNQGVKHSSKSELWADYDTYTKGNLQIKVIHNKVSSSSRRGHLDSLSYTLVVNNDISKDKMGMEAKHKNFDSLAELKGYVLKKQGMSI